MLVGKKLSEISPMEKDLGVLVYEKLNTGQPCGLATQKAKSILGCIKKGVIGRVREVIVPLYSVLVHLEYCIQTWYLQHKKYKEVCRAVGAGPKEGHKDDQKAGIPLL